MNYWDWLWPYYSEKIKIFSINSFAWSSVSDLGHSLSYTSNYLVNFLISFLSFFPNPEGLLFLLLFLLAVALFIGSLKMRINIIFTLIILLNPAVFYKLLSGHFYYLISLVVFIWLIYWMLYKYQKNIYSTFITGLFFAFIGVQIQFFVFSFIILVIYFVFNKNKFNLLFFNIILIIAILINLPWLSNFILNVSSISSTSLSALEAFFSESSFASPLRLLGFTFSPATNIQFIYSKPWLSYFSIFSILTIISAIYYLIVIRKSSPAKYDSKKDKTILFFISNWIVFSILGTGFFHKIPIPIIKTFYPMFRESGHFAPLIILFEVLTFAYTWSFLRDKIANFCTYMNKKWVSNIKNILNIGLNIYLIIFVCVNAYYMVNYLPRVDYVAAREKFQTFEDFAQTDSSVHRVLTYPFWNQYGFIDKPNIYKNDKLINNSGWDSYIAFSGKDHISNYAPGGYPIHNTLQYKLLKTFDISELENMNVKYIYDFSNFYESNFENYTQAWTYDYDLSLIKNDINFQDKLIKNNPDRIEIVSDKILKLTHFKPRINGQNIIFKRINPTQYRIKINNLKDKTDLKFLENYHKDWVVKVVPINKDKNGIPHWCETPQKYEYYPVLECKEAEKFMVGNELKLLFIPNIAQNNHNKLDDYANEWNVIKDEITNLGESYYQKNEDGSIGVELVIYFWPQTYLLISILTSIITIGVLLGFLVYSKLRKKNELTK